MGVDDYMDREAGAVAAVTAAAVSPRARQLFRRGAVYGIAGVLRAGDVAVAAARGAVRGAKEATTGASRPATTRGAKPTTTGRAKDTTTGGAKPATGGSSRGRQSRSPDGAGSTNQGDSGGKPRGSSRSTQARPRRRSTSSASRS